MQRVLISLHSEFSMIRSDWTKEPGVLVVTNVSLVFPHKRQPTRHLGWATQPTKSLLDDSWCQIVKICGSPRQHEQESHIFLNQILVNTEVANFLTNLCNAQSYFLTSSNEFVLTCPYNQSAVIWKYGSWDTKLKVHKKI